MIIRKNLGHFFEKDIGDITVPYRRRPGEILLTFNLDMMLLNGSIPDSIRYEKISFGSKARIKGLKAIYLL